MVTNVAIIVSILVSSITAQLLVAPQYASYGQALVGGQPALAHNDVLLNAQMESNLPEELIRSNKFYRNPAVAAGLAKESWFTDKEMPVYEREATKISRDQIYKIVKSAGFVRRR